MVKLQDYQVFVRKFYINKCPLLASTGSCILFLRCYSLKGHIIVLFLKTKNPIILFVALVAITSVAWLPHRTMLSPKAEPAVTVNTGKSAGTRINNTQGFYQHLKLDAKGLSRQAFELACKGYERLVEKGQLDEGAYLVVCDFSQSSNQKRLYLIDMEDSVLVKNTYVAHGKNSGNEYALKFSNKPESLQSSLGFFVTRNTYNGAHGLSLKLDGMEQGINDKAMQRNIVVHGADYIGNNWLQFNKYMGRSFGCPALPAKESASIINTIKDGSCLFIYHPTASNYPKRSKLLNV